MSTSWDWKTNISMKALNKTANPSTGTVPPLVVDAALYSGPTTDTSIYLYGGTTSYVNTSFPGYQDPTSSQYALWSYDTAGDEWSQYDVSLHAPNRPAGGAYAEAPEQGLAFWLNGYINNGTSNKLEEWDGLLEYMNGLIVIDTNKQTATNVSTSSLKNFPRVRGGLTYIPGIGEKGILVSVGGATKSTSDTTDSNQGSFVRTTHASDIFMTDSTGILRRSRHLRPRLPRHHHHRLQRHLVHPKNYRRRPRRPHRLLRRNRHRPRQLQPQHLHLRRQRQQPDLRPDLRSLPALIHLDAGLRGRISAIRTYVPSGGESADGHGGGQFDDGFDGGVRLGDEGGCGL